MNKYVSRALYVALVLIIAFLAFIAHAISTLGDPVKVTNITQGTIGSFSIGDSKQVIISKVKNESFSPEPKPTECPKNWIKLSEISEVQKSCLLKTDIWNVGYFGKEQCPEKTDHHVSLHFADEHLYEVVIKCTPAK